MKKLFEQLVKFGLVGVVAFVIDEGVMNLLLLVHVHNVVASTASFLISLVFNYWASMKYVFVHRKDMARWMEMLIFLVSSIIGLFINEVIIYLSTIGMAHDAMVSDHAAYTLRTNIGKLIATVVVAIWNFVIRKWLLDATNHADASAGERPMTNATGSATAASAAVPASASSAKAPEAAKDSFSHKLGIWSLEHSPKGWK